ncbi:MAG: GmrSD restriction endonuclease domain-containing protein [Thermomicrobiales bacterium]
MKDAQKPDHVSLNGLLGQLRDGRYVIPDFQREFEWEPWDIRDLMRSIFMDYYIGSLLLWKGKDENFDALSCAPMYGFEGELHREYIVLDGQQRLTAMYYAFIGPNVPLPKRLGPGVFYLNINRFMDEEYDQAFHYDYYSKRIEKLLSDTEAQYAAHFFPMTVVGQAGFALAKWVFGYEHFWEQKAAEAAAFSRDDEADEAIHHVENAREFGDHLKGITEQYQISYVELDRELAIDKVCDIFTQVNSKGIRLDIFDLMNALIRPRGLQLKHMWRAAAPRLEFVDSEKMNVYILQVMSILRQAYCSPKYLYFLLPGQKKPVRDADGRKGVQILVSDVEDFERLWNEAVTALESAINLLRHPMEFGVITGKYLPYVSILPVFAALQAHLKALPSELRLSGQRKLRHWYWASIFLNRYSGSVESTSARDYLDVRSWIRDDAAAPPFVKEFESRFKTLDLRRETNTGSSVYSGIFNLLVLGGAQDWIAGMVPQYDDLDDHHIVPTSWGFKHLDGNLIHSVLNRTPLTSDTNRHVIRDRLPNTYLPELMNSNGAQKVRQVLETHLISPAAVDILLRDPFEPKDFDDFIEERQRTIQQAIEDLLIKERMDLSPSLRELDQRIEAVELGLRRFISLALHNDPGQLPSHVSQRIQERIQTAMQKDPALDGDRFGTLQGMLEYSDLRELQQAMCSNATWPRFQERFGTKELLGVKFTQLADARNGIRHSRSINEVTRMEGEAATIWFGQLLS